MRYMSICVFIFFNITVLLAVNLNQPNNTRDNIDKVYIDLSQNILVSGQYLNYKAYIINPSRENNISTSKILYFEIIDSACQKVMTWRCNVSSGISNGSVLIPDTISGGLYHLRAFTNWMRNFGVDNFFTTPLIITHLTEHKLNKLTFSSKDKIILAEHDSLKEDFQTTSIRRKNNNEITVQLSKNTYKRNEKVSIELFANLQSDEILNASITVKEINKLEKILNPPEISELSIYESSPLDPDRTNDVKNGQNVPKSITYQMESSGYLLSGKLLNESTGNGISEIPVFLSKTDSMVQFKFTTTNNVGEFGFLLGTNFDNHKLVLQTPEITNQIKYTWEIDNKWDNKETTAGYSNYYLSKDEETELENIRTTELIKKLYLKGTENTYHSKYKKEQSFYFTPDYVVKPEDYEELTDFTDISNNILPLVRFKKTKNGYSLYVFLKEIDRDAGGETGLFVNGTPFFNLEYIATLTYKDIERIEVCTHPIMYGNQTFYGIVSIFTKKLNLNPDAFNNPVYRIDNKVTEEAATPNNNALINRQTVFYTQCIYWNPEVIVEEKKPTKIEFETPNIETAYQVSIRGLSNKGVPFSKTVFFKIED